MIKRYLFVRIKNSYGEIYQCNICKRDILPEEYEREEITGMTASGYFHNKCITDGGFFLESTNGPHIEITEEQFEQIRNMTRI